MPQLEGILRLPKKIPQDQREWEQFLRRFNEQFFYDGTRAIIAEAATIAEREGTDIGTILQRISDQGRAKDQRFLPTVTFGNVASVQNIEPLSASAGSTTANVLVAAHTLHTDFGVISYNSGAVVGLALNTRYYVYTDDPDYEGGAVTYVASTSRPNIPANSGRYFVGTIETPSASANTELISAATSANPIEFTTSAPHGWSTADTVQLDGLPDAFGTALNGTQHLITVTAPDKFTIPIDGSAFAAYTAGGTASRIVPDTGNDYGGGGGGYLP